TADECFRLDCAGLRLAIPCRDRLRHRHWLRRLEGDRNRAEPAGRGAGKGDQRLQRAEGHDGGDHGRHPRSLRPAGLADRGATRPTPASSQGGAVETLDQCTALIGDLHRPFAVIAASAAGAVATVVVAFKVDGCEGAALFIGAVWGGVAGLYWGRAWENARS